MKSGVRRPFRAALLALAALGGAWGEGFDTYTYEAPAGYTLRTHEQGAEWSRIDQKRRFYCQIGLYRAQRSVGGPAQDFEAEWKAVVVKQMRPTGAPKPANPNFAHAPGSLFAVVEGIDGNGNKVITTLFVVRFPERYVGVLFNVPNDEAFQACQKEATRVAGSVRLSGAAPSMGPGTAAPAVISGGSPVGRWERVIASQIPTRYNPFTKAWEHDPVAAMNQFRQSHVFQLEANGQYTYTLDAESYNRNERSMVVERGSYSVANGAIAFRPASYQDGKCPRGQTPPLTARTVPAPHERRFLVGEHPQYKDSAGLQLQTKDGGWETFKPLR